MKNSINNALNNKNSTLRKVLATAPAFPYMAWAIVFIAVPLGLIVYFALTDSAGAFTVANITRAGEHMSVLFRSIMLEFIATVLCVLIAYPMAYIFSRK